MILVLGSAKDPHIQAVAKHANLHVIDTAELPTLNADLSDSGVSLGLGDIDLADVKTVWLRRITGVNTPFAKPEDRSFVASETMIALRSVSRLMNCRWVNSVASVVEHDGGAAKAWQLAVAAKEGFKIPDTLITTDPQAAKEFLEEHESVVLKVHRSPRKPVYTRRLPKGSDMSGVALMPTYLQEEIKKDYELRVCVWGQMRAGSQVMATKIMSQTDKRSEVDFRLCTAVPHLPEDLPWDVTDRLHFMNVALGLEFGVYDLIRDVDGNYVFLEVNQQGQWIWLENKTGQPYAETMANFLKLS